VKRALLLILVACGGAPTFAEYHRPALLQIASGQLDCDPRAIATRDTTPEDWDGFMTDPEARRYTAEGCGRERTYICFELVYTNNPMVECRPLAERNDDRARPVEVRIGPERVN